MLPLAGLTAIISSIAGDLDRVPSEPVMARDQGSGTSDDDPSDEPEETAWDREIDAEINCFLARDYPELLAERPDPDDLDKALSRMMARHSGVVDDADPADASIEGARARTKADTEP